MANFKFDNTTGTMKVVVPEMPEVKDKAEVVENLEKPVAESASIVGETVNQPNTDTEEDEVIFKKFSDLSIMRVDDKATGKWLCYFSGYALDIRFNMEELKGSNPTKKIEACLEGLNKLFRKIILDQALDA